MIPKTEADLYEIGFSYAGNNVKGFVQASQFRIAATQSPARWRGLDTVNIPQTFNIKYSDTCGISPD